MTPAQEPASVAYSMAIQTLGQLLGWLLETPRTRLETLRATQASPEDLASAISLLVAGNHLCMPVLTGRRLQTRARGGPGKKHLLELPIAGCHARNRFRDTDRLRDWVDVSITAAGRLWAKQSKPARSESETAVLAERFLATRLGRHATDREVALFWQVVDTEAEEPLRR